MFGTRMDEQDTMFVLRSFVQLGAIIQELEPRNDMLTELASYQGRRSRREIATDEFRFFEIADLLIDMLRGFPDMERHCVDGFENLLRKDIWAKTETFDPGRDLDAMRDRYLLKCSDDYCRTYIFRFTDYLYAFKDGLCREWDVRDLSDRLDRHRKWYMARARAERFSKSRYNFPSTRTDVPGRDPFSFRRDGERFMFDTIVLPRPATDVSIAIQEFFDWNYKDERYDQKNIVPMSMIVCLAHRMGRLKSPHLYWEVQAELDNPTIQKKMAEIAKRFKIGEGGIRKMIELKRSCMDDLERYAENVDVLLKNDSAGSPL